MPRTGFGKILIANRGEIACRIMRTAHEMGYATVAVFSDADANALHVKMAGEAFHIGASPPAESYLNIAAILNAASKTGADAIHPGYGFLAENASFADACEAAGIVFVGPPADVIRTLGDKAQAKALAVAAGVPCVPGYMSDRQSHELLKSEAVKLGFPLLIKAVAGGGGRGIRAVFDGRSFNDELSAAGREADAAFGDGRLMLEKLIERPRHIEVQVFGDAHGNVVHLFERDCTTQRRRQKIIEEAPSPALTEEMREKITGHAIAIARKANYRNAGTVEFIADRDGSIFFLEVNTRLQVEHPVTEMLTGLDLVEWQLRVAAGEPLPLAQDRIERKGHAIEVRLCAEDPSDSFRPQTGDAIFWRPTAPAGIRYESGIEEGGSVSPFYDSMIAKVIAHGANRAEATRKLAAALRSNPLLGLKTNQTFLLRLLQSSEFSTASLSTTDLDGWSEAGHELFEKTLPPEETVALAAALFANGSKLPLTIELEYAGAAKTVRYRPGSNGASIFEADGRQSSVTVLSRSFPENLYTYDGVRRRAVAVFKDGSLHLSRDGASFIFKEKSAGSRGRTADTDGLIRAPVAGRIAKVFVQNGDAVSSGSTLAIIEAMKMQIRVTSPADGAVRSLAVAEGGQIAQGAIVCEIGSEANSNG